MYHYWYTSIMPDEKIIKVAFYRTPADNEPVHDWLKDLLTEEKKMMQTNETIGNMFADFLEK